MTTNTKSTGSAVIDNFLALMRGTANVASDKAERRTEHGKANAFLRKRPLAVSARQLNKIQPLTVEQIVAAFKAQQIRGITEGCPAVIATAQIEAYAADCMAGYLTNLAFCDANPDLDPSEIEALHRNLWLTTHAILAKSGEDYLNAAVYEYTAPTAAEVLAAERKALAERFTGAGFRVTNKRNA